MKKYNVKKSWEVVNEQVGFGTTVFDYNEAIQMVQDYGGRYLGNRERTLLISIGR